MALANDAAPMYIDELPFPIFSSIFCLINPCLAWFRWAYYSTQRNPLTPFTAITVTHVGHAYRRHILEPGATDARARAIFLPNLILCGQVIFHPYNTVACVLSGIMVAVEHKQPGCSWSSTKVLQTATPYPAECFQNWNFNANKPRHIGYLTTPNPRAKCGSPLRPSMRKSPYSNILALANRSRTHVLLREKD